jgi:hypothetical protein
VQQCHKRLDAILGTRQLLETSPSSPADDPPIGFIEQVHGPVVAAAPPCGLCGARS